MNQLRSLPLFPFVLLLLAAACDRPDVLLISPTQLSPASGSVFDIYPRTTNLVWTRVPGAASYAVEVDPYCPDKAMWCSESGATNLVYQASGIKDTTHTFEHVGAQAGRWRVWAVNRAGTTSPKTGWWQFEYAR